MNPDFHPIVNGIYLLLGVQLISVAIVQLILGPKKQVYLSLLCLIMGMWFFRRFFWEHWGNNALGIILVGGYKEVFIGPLIYFYIHSKWKSVSTKQLLVHFSIPAVLYLRYIVMRIGFSEVYFAHSLLNHWLLVSFLVVSYTTYYVLCLKDIKVGLEPSLLRRAYLRTKWFFFSVFTFQLMGIFLTILSTLAQGKESDFWTYLNGTLIYYFDWAIETPYHIAMSVYVVIYSLFEMPYLRKLIMGNQMQVRKEEVGENVSDKIAFRFIKEKLFTQSDLNLNKSLEVLDISRQDFSNYLKLEGHESFSAFVNGLRVAEFKRLVENKEYLKYDLVSLAELAGFNSKATFNRVFKTLEGNTPKEFVKSIQNKGQNGGDSKPNTE
ncbi:MAG: helix-turn-helix transcriptional regulator [Cytophagia bacterium]|nr:helix-turn-helix transcriptional regulator [Cytophagia bacterium]